MKITTTEGPPKKRIWKTGDTAYVIIVSRPEEEYNSYSYRTTGMTIIQFWTGTGFASYRDAKLFKTQKEAEDVTVQMILTDPKRYMGHLEVVEQAVWSDLWA